MSQDQKLARAEFDARLKAIDARFEAAREISKPYRDALQPFEEAENAIMDERADFIEGQELLGVFDSRCIECGAPIFDGDLVCRHGDEGYECEECAPTLAEALENNEDAFEGGHADDDLLRSVARIKELIEAHGPDAKAVSPL